MVDEPLNQRWKSIRKSKRSYQTNGILTSTFRRYIFSFIYDRVCIFCEQSDPNFDEAKLDHHYWNECQMLINCPLFTRVGKGVGGMAGQGWRVEGGDEARGHNIPPSLTPKTAWG